MIFIYINGGPGGAWWLPLLFLLATWALNGGISQALNILFATVSAAWQCHGTLACARTRLLSSALAPAATTCHAARASKQQPCCVAGCLQPAAPLPPLLRCRRAADVQHGRRRGRLAGAAP